MTAIFELIQNKMFWWGVSAVVIAVALVLRFSCGYMSDIEEDYEKIDKIEFSSPGEYDRECMRLTGRPCENTSE